MPTPRHVAVVCPNTRKMRRLLRGTRRELDDSELTDDIGAGIMAPIPLIDTEDWGRPVVSLPRPDGVRLAAWCLPITQLSSESRDTLIAIETEFPMFRVIVSSLAESHAAFRTRWQNLVNWPGDARPNRPTGDS